MDRYQNQHSFVWQYGTSLIDLAKPVRGERILDIGCGTGELTNQLWTTTASSPLTGSTDAMVCSVNSDHDSTANHVAISSSVWGMDADSSMISKA